MSSILTNTSAMSALQTLRSITNDMGTTQERISSGMRVGSASDNAAYWSIATTMRSDNAALSSVQDALGLGAAKIDTAYAGMESAIDVVQEIKNKLITAQESTADKSKIQEEISQLQDQLTSITDSASFSGENWLKAKIGVAGEDGGAATVEAIAKQVVGSFTRDASGNVKVQSVDISLDETNVLIDTSGNNKGLLDAQALKANLAKVSVTVGGEAADYYLETKTTKEVDALVAAWVAEGTEDEPNVATRDGTGAVTFGTDDDAVTYVQVADGKWALAATDEIEDQAATTIEGTTTGTYYLVLDDAVEGDEIYAQNVSVAKLDISDMDALRSSFGFGEDATDNEVLAAALSHVDAQLESMTSAAAGLGAVSSRINMQNEFVSKLSDSLESGIGRLVDADMNEESTRLKALQTQQQLAIQALSIANSDSQNILSLFR